MCTKRRERTSKKQFELIINYLENNNDMFSFEKTSNYFPKIEKKWTKLAEELNNIGPQKTIKEWKNVISEWKTNTKKKARYIKDNLKGTGGGPKLNKQLNDLEERLLSLMSKIIIDGAPNIEEPGLKQSTENEESFLENNANFMLSDMNIIIESNALEECNESGTFLNFGNDIEISKQNDMTTLQSSNTNMLPPTKTKRKTVIETQVKETEAENNFDIPNRCTPKRKRQVEKMSNNNIEKVLNTHTEHLQLLVSSNNKIADAIVYLADSLKESIAKLA